MASQIGLIETELKTAVETTSIVTCFLGMFSDDIGSVDKPFAKLIFGDSTETKDDMNGYRDVWYPFVVAITGDDKETVRVALDEIRILFDPGTIRNTLAGTTMRVIQIDYVGESTPIVFRSHSNCTAEIEFTARVRYTYAQ